MPTALSMPTVALGVAEPTPTARWAPTAAVGVALIYADGRGYPEGTVIGLALPCHTPTATIKGPRGSPWPSVNLAIPVVRLDRKSVV